MSGTGVLYGAICLRACYAMSGTGVRYGAICRRACYAVSSTDLAYGTARKAASKFKRMVISELEVSPIFFCACYAMSATDIAHAAIYLRACYAMSGTNIAYRATRLMEGDCEGLDVGQAVADPRSLRPHTPISLRIQQLLCYGFNA
eukprot:1878258-Rhodomonas_salina.5